MITPPAGMGPNETLGLDRPAMNGEGLRERGGWVGGPIRAGAKNPSAREGTYPTAALDYGSPAFDRGG